MIFLWNEVEGEDSDDKDNLVHSNAEVWTVEDGATDIENDKIKPANSFNLFCQIKGEAAMHEIYTHTYDRKDFQ